MVTLNSQGGHGLWRIVCLAQYDWPASDHILLQATLKLCSPQLDLAGTCTLAHGPAAELKEGILSDSDLAPMLITNCTLCAGACDAARVASSIL